MAEILKRGKLVLILAMLCLFCQPFSGAGKKIPLPEILPAVLATEADDEEQEGSNSVKAKLIADCKAIKPGADFKLGVEFKMSPGWHIYYRESGDAGMPTSISWQLPEGFSASELLWQKPQKIVDAGIVTYGYEESTVIASNLKAPANLPAGKKLTFKAKVNWLSCKDSCVPGSALLELNLPVHSGNEKVVSDPLETEKFQGLGFNGPLSELSEKPESSSTSLENKNEDSSKKKTDKRENFGGAKSESGGEGFIAYLGFAFIGGFILNFMPCVLPVISIKVFSLIQQAGEDKRKIFQHGITFVLGIVISFLLLGLLVIALQGAGQKIGWGFQFQYPVFVLSMSSIVTLFALSMFGVFYVDLSAGQGSIDKLAGSEGLAGTFFKGVLATVLSTPCTAPFLGTALGFAFAQPWWQILSIFLLISLGMSFPYFLLALRPDWLKFLPRPGAWMEKFKESMGFLLLATVIWLISVLGGLVDPDALAAAMGFLLSLSLSAWIVGGFINLSSSLKRKFVVWSIAFLNAYLAYFFFLKPYPELLGTKASIETGESKKDPLGIDWQKFSQAALDRTLSENKTVFLDFTAKWCLTCKVNEGTIINTEPVIAKIKELNIVAFKADWTAQDAEISDLLARFGRSGVPVYVIYPAGKADKPVLLPEMLTQDILLKALSDAGPSK